MWPRNFPYKNFDLLSVLRDDDEYILAYDGEPIRTPEGNVASHRSECLLREIMNNVRWKVINPFETQVGPFDFWYLWDMYCLQKDRVESGDDWLEVAFDEMTIMDRLFYVRDSVRQSPEVQVVMNWLNKNNIELPNLRPKIPEEILIDVDHNINISKWDIFREFEDAFLIPKPTSRFVCQLKQIYMSLESEKKAFVLNNFTQFKDVVFPLAIVLDQCPVRYYEIVLRNGEVREDVDLWMEYVRLYPVGLSERGVLDEIKLGEDKTREFKSTLRLNLHSGKNDDGITHSCLKTIAAFLNTNEGRLLIGISDKGEIVGIENDGFPDNDKYQLHLFNLIKEYLGNHIASLVNTEMIKIGEKFICLVTCERSPEPVYLNFKKRGEEYFIRTGPGTTKLSTSEAHKYITNKFSN